MADLQGTRSIEIAADAERCFAIAADLDRVPEWHGAMTDVEVLERGPVRERVEALLADRPVEGLKARAEATA